MKIKTDWTPALLAIAMSVSFARAAQRAPARRALTFSRIDRAARLH